MCCPPCSMHWENPVFPYISWFFPRCSTWCWTWCLSQRQTWAWPVWHGQRWSHRAFRQCFPFSCCCGNWSVSPAEKPASSVTRNCCKWRELPCPPFYSNPLFPLAWCWCSQWWTASVPRRWLDFRRQCGWSPFALCPWRRSATPSPPTLPRIWVPDRKNEW